MVMGSSSVATERGAAGGSTLGVSVGGSGSAAFGAHSSPRRNASRAEGWPEAGSGVKPRIGALFNGQGNLDGVAELTIVSRQGKERKGLAPSGERPWITFPARAACSRRNSRERPAIEAAL